MKTETMKETRKEKKMPNGRGEERIQQRRRRGLNGHARVAAVNAV